MRRIRIAAVVIALFAVVVGCSSPEAQPTNTAESPSEAAYPNLADWRPTTQITPRTFTPDEVQQLVNARLELERPGSAEGVPIPEPKAVLDGRERDVALAQCMTDAGFPAEASPAGGYIGKLSSG